MANLWLLRAAFLFWIFTAALTQLSLFQGKDGLRKASRVTSWAGLLFLCLFLVRRFQTVGLPLGSFFDSLIFLAWGMGIVHVSVSSRPERQSLAAMLSPLVVMTLAIAGLLPAAGQAGGALLDRRLLVLHVMLILIGYSAFALSFVCASFYILVERLLKSKRFAHWITQLPSLVVLDRIGYRSVVVGFVFLTAGLLSGFIGVRGTAGASLTDPKIILSGIMWLVYAIYLILRAGAGWQGRQVNRLLLFGFAVMIATYFGGSYLSPGAHRFW